MRQTPGLDERRPLPAIVVGRWRVAIDLPHLAFITGIAGWCAWYCSDAWRAAANVQNLILVLPATIGALLLYLFVLRECVTVSRVTASPTRSVRAVIAPLVAKRIIGLMLLLAAYVVAGPIVGYDVASVVYLFATLFFLGERRLYVLLPVPAVFCIIAVYCFQTILATPLPVLFFGAAP
jgi:hypothetical protein